MQKLVWTLIIVLFAGIVACNKEDNGNDGSGDGFDRKAMLTHLADNLIIPAYSSYQTALAEMKGAADAFAAAPDAAKLALLRQKWQAAYISWQQVEQYSFGPADQVLLRNYSNIYPTDVTLLHSYVSSGSYDLEVLTNNKVQGFPGLDYLINGVGSNDTEIINVYTSGADGAKWKKYLGDVVNTMSTKTAKVVSDWKGTYRQQFISSDGTGAGSSLSLMVNEYIMNFERFLRSGKFGIPAGVMSGTPAPEKVEAFYAKDLGITLAKTALEASRNFYLGKAFSGGTAGPGLHSYLQVLGKNNANLVTLAASIESQFGAIEAKMNTIGNSVYDAINNNRNGVLAVYDELQKQVRLLKVDMASAIGITISYTDNDGD